jgi:A/G-specific adenine glycosylase
MSCTASFKLRTRVAPGTVGPLHPGVAALASRTKLPVIPVVTDSGLHWGRRAFRKIPGVIRIAIQPPLPANLPREELLTRLHAIEGDPTQSATLSALWDLADTLTPAERCADYTQAIMDLGATLCTRSRPACPLCPLAATCVARAEGTPTRYPARKRSRRLAERRCGMLVIRNDAGEFLLEKRPSPGIWGGLWSFPEIGADDDAASACEHIAGEAPLAVQRGTPFRHTFSHFHLDITPVHLAVPGLIGHVLEDQRLAWYKPGQRALGLAAPVKKLIDALT